MVTRSHRRLLLVAYHFPPIQGSTGTNRTIAFSRFLKQYGWDVCVLTIQSGAYEDTEIKNERFIPNHVRVERACGFNARRRFAILGRYPLILALPDRWQSWIVGGYFRGSAIVREWKPDVIMSTYPIPSAHLIGYLLHRKFDLPWVAEFRDPMLQQSYPASAWERWAYSKVEQLVFGNASQVVVTAGGCRQMYLDRFPNFDSESICTISNGYDRTVFEEEPTSIDSRRSNKITLLHSGLLYPHERNPDAFFRAVRSLSQKGVLEDWNIEFRFRASGNEDSYRKIIGELEIEPYVSFHPRLSYAEAVQEMQSVNALMIFQADNCNFQIPAKIYEYLYCRKPIIGLTDPCGDTGKLLQGLGIRSIAKLEDSDQIERVLYNFLHDLHKGDNYTVPMTSVEKFSRESLTKDLGRVLMRAACPQ